MTDASTQDIARPIESRRVTDTEFDVPPDATVYDCEYCGRPFTREDYCALHRGLAHPDRLSADQRVAFDDVFEGESADLRRFRLVSLGALVLLYFGFLFAYAVFA
ncbi:MAG: DUF7410 domain-containing protein [Halobacteriota archaeon]